MSADSEESTGIVRAWDLPTRVFHWSLVVLLACAWVSYEYSDRLGDYTLRWHRWNGIAVLTLLVWRLLWGFAGSSTSRFSSFFRWPGAAVGYAVDLVRGRGRAYLGHNPLGTYSIIVLFGAVAVQAMMGLFTVEHNDLTAGPLYRLVAEPVWQAISKWHRWTFYWVILPVVAVHVTVNILYGVLKNDPVIAAMITGFKPRKSYADAAEARIVSRPLVRAALCLLAAAAIVLGGITALGGRL